MAFAKLRAVEKVAEPTAFEAARARWDGISASRRGLKAKLDNAKAALALAEHPPGEHDIRSPVLEAKARDHLAGRRPNAELLRREVLKLDDLVTQAATTYAAEADLWREALAAESVRRAALVRPRHRAAVRRIGQLVEQLSLAVEAERAIRSELVEVGSHALPDASREFGTLHEYGSLISSWNRRLLGEGALDP